MPDLTYDTTLSASSFSAVAGIIAGFAFAVLVWAFDRVDGSKDSAETDDDSIRALTFLLIGFLGNILVAFLYAALAGQTNPFAPRAIILDFLAGACFSALTVLTVEALVLMVAYAGNAWLNALFRRVFVFSIGINVLVQLISTLALMRKQPGTAPILQADLYLLIGAAVAGLLPIAAGLWLSNRESDRCFGLNSRRSFSGLLWAVMLFILLITVISGLFFGVPLDSELPFWAIIAIRIGWLALVGWACVFLPFQRRAPNAA